MDTAVAYIQTRHCCRLLYSPINGYWSHHLTHMNSRGAMLVWHMQWLFWWKKRKPKQLLEKNSQPFYCLWLNHLIKMQVVPTVVSWTVLEVTHCSCTELHWPMTCCQLFCLGCHIIAHMGSPLLWMFFFLFHFNFN